jgi:hypothetical protein
MERWPRTTVNAAHMQRNGEVGQGLSSFGAFQNRPMPAKQNQSTPHVIKIGT